MLWVCFSGEMFRTKISVNILIKAFVELGLKILNVVNAWNRKLLCITSVNERNDVQCSCS